MKIADRVRRVLTAEHISDEEFGIMLKHAANIRAEGGNRRYHQWLFDVDAASGAVNDMRLLEPIEVGTGEGTVSEEHEACGGEGCRACGWIGRRLRRIHDVTATRLG